MIISRMQHLGLVLFIIWTSAVVSTSSNAAIYSTAAQADVPPATRLPIWYFVSSSMQKSQCEASCAEPEACVCCAYACTHYGLKRIVCSAQDCPKNEYCPLLGALAITKDEPCVVTNIPREQPTTMRPSPGPSLRGLPLSAAEFGSFSSLSPSLSPSGSPTGSLEYEYEDMVDDEPTEASLDEFSPETGTEQDHDGTPSPTPTEQ